MSKYSIRSARAPVSDLYHKLPETCVSCLVNGRTLSLNINFKVKKASLVVKRQKKSKSSVVPNNEGILSELTDCLFVFNLVRAKVDKV